MTFMCIVFLGKVVFVFASHLWTLCFWERWSLSCITFMCIMFICIVFLREVVLSLYHIYVHHVYMHCVFGFGIENHLHLSFKGKTLNYSFGLHGLCIALCLCVSQVASHLKIIYTFKFLNISPLTTIFIDFIF